MTRDEWARLLEPWAAAVLQRVESEGYEPDEIEVGTGPFSGLGFPGATEAELAAAEARLGCRLPPSYREFLACTNGLRQADPCMAALGGHFWGADGIEWLRVRNAEVIEIWNEDPIEIPDEEYFVYGEDQDCMSFRPQYLRDALEISYEGDAGWYLLIPDVAGADGEWEAWFFASWHPGAHRYRSFAEMMLARHRRFQAGGASGF